MHKTEYDYLILDAMSAYGGSFVQQLSKLARVADTTNFAKLKVTFANYWEEYDKLLPESDRKQKV
jgi:hypothetical protein